VEANDNSAQDCSTQAESDRRPKPGSFRARGSRVRFPNRKAE